MEMTFPGSSLDPESFEDEKCAGTFICMICGEVPNPHTAVEETACGKIFCGNCLEKWADIKADCPHYNCDFTDTQRPVESGNKIVYRMLMNMRTRCPARCPWVGFWENLEKHLLVCENVVTMCRYGCATKSIRKDIKAHEETECKYRMVNCTHCFGVFKFCELEGHMNECSKHEKAKLPCSYLDLGCDFKGNLDERRKHEEVEKSQHLKLALVRIEQLKGKLEETKKSKDRGYVLGNKYAVTVHEHPLKFVIKDNGWACNGKNFKGGCKSGFKDFDETKGVLRFRCRTCDFDFCEKCLLAYFKAS